MQQEIDDEHILDLILHQRRENEGYRLLMTKYQDKLYWHIRSMVDYHSDADDVLQNTFIKVFRNLHGFQRKSQLYTWLYRIATNESITFLNKRKKKMTDDIDSIDAHRKNQLRAEHHLDAEDVEKLLKEAILTLPEKQMIVFQMRYYDELTYQQISELMGTSTGGLKASFHHAVKKIEKYLVNKKFNS